MLVFKIDTGVMNPPAEVPENVDVPENVGEAENTGVDVPVGVVHTLFVPFETRIWPFVPIVVRPVPPLANGRAVPEYPIANVPAVVIGDPVIDKNPNNVSATAYRVQWLIRKIRCQCLLLLSM